MIAGTLYFATLETCLGCDASYPGLTLSSANFYDGLTGSSSNPPKANLSISFNNPEAETYVTSLSVTEERITITTWQDGENSTSLIDFSVHSPANVIASGKVTNLTYYPRTAFPVNITAGEDWNYVIVLANGESVSGSLISE